MSEPTPFPADKRQAAAEALKRDRDARHANSVKQGRQAERADWCKALGVASMEEATEIGHLRRELKERPTLAEIAHARHASRGYSMFTGAVIGGALIVATAAALSWIWAGYGHDMALTGAAVQASNPAQPLHTCSPGDQMPDGHICGAPLVQRASPQAQPQN